VDERLSTVNAQTKARAAGKSTRDTKNLIDAFAAVEILERGLSRERAQ
jgi:RNase H-fold protein (predicted Holliday junction resolvase)